MKYTRKSVRAKNKTRKNKKRMMKGGEQDEGQNNRIVLQRQTQGTVTVLKEKNQEIKERDDQINEKDNQIQQLNARIEVLEGEKKSLNEKISKFIQLYYKSDKNQVSRVNDVVGKINSVAETIKSLPQLKTICGIDEINPEKHFGLLKNFT